MITSTSNAQVKRLVQLQKKSRFRRSEGVFVAEGIRMFRETPPERIERAYLSESLYRKGLPMPSGVRPEVLADDVFRRVSDTDAPQGVLVTVRMQETQPAQMLERKAAAGAQGKDDAAGTQGKNDAAGTQGKNDAGAQGKDAAAGTQERPDAAPLLVLLENLQDPGNLGTIVRAAEAAGVDGILMSRDCVDIYNPKVIRATMGGIYRVPFAYVDDLPETIRMLGASGVAVYAAHLAQSVDYDRVDYRKASAFLIGNEGSGLTEQAVSAAAKMIRIPMLGKVESLNASVAAAALMFEAARQRRHGKDGSAS